MADLLAKLWVKTAVVVLLGALFWVLWPANGTDTPGDESNVAGGSSESAQEVVESGESAGLARDLGDETAVGADMVQVDGDEAGSTQSDTAVMVLWLLAGATTVLLIGFLFHTSPRRRARDRAHVA